jgi:hypothetical protein
MVNLNKESMFFCYEIANARRVANTFLRIWIKADPKSIKRWNSKREYLRENKNLSVNFILEKISQADIFVKYL